jgi:hypothetical protein
MLWIKCTDPLVVAKENEQVEARHAHLHQKITWLVLSYKIGAGCCSLGSCANNGILKAAACVCMRANVGSSLALLFQKPSKIPRCWLSCSVEMARTAPQRAGIEMNLSAKQAWRQKHSRGQLSREL